MRKPKSIQQVLQENMMTYAASVIVDRAIPDVRDGYKPVHRRLLITMDMMKAYNLTKCANITGETMKLHPHGDSYDSLVGIVQTDHHSIQPVIGKGSFGQHTSSTIEAAAPRYTEAKLSPMMIEMMQGVKNDEVDLIPNFDNTKQIPEVIPMKYPNVLCNSLMGMAVGIATEIPEFNMKEVCYATSKYLTTGEQDLLVPDFPTGGKIIYNEEAIKSLNYQGFGTTRIRGRHHFEGNTMIITEIPYQTTREAIISKLVDAVKKGKLKEVSEIKDLTDLKGMKIEVTFKRGTNLEVSAEKIYLLTPLESAQSANMNVLVDGYPKKLGTWQMIDEWIKFRMSCVYRARTKEIKELQKELHIMYGLRNVLLDIEKAIEIIRKYESDEEISIALQSQFNIDDVQAEKVMNMPLKNINKTHIHKRIRTIQEKEERLRKLQEECNDGSIKKIIAEELIEVADKYGKDRKTEILYSLEKPEIQKEIIKKVNIDTNDYHVITTKQGYFKRIDTLRGNIGLKDGDEITQQEQINIQDGLLVLVDSAGWIYTCELSKTGLWKPQELGAYLPTEWKIKGEPILTKVFNTKYNNELTINLAKGEPIKIKISEIQEKRRKFKLVNKQIVKVEVK